MKGKKKLWLALSAFALMLVVAGASVGITLAALSGSVNSQFNITYTAINVEATLKAKWASFEEKDKASAEYTDIKSGTATEIEFTNTTPNDQATKSFDQTTAKFTSPAADFYVAFYFKNTSTTNSLKVNVKYAAGSSKNVTVVYGWVDGEAGYTGTALTGVGQAIPNTLPEKAIAKSGTSVLWVKVSITKNIESATFAGSFTFDLHGEAPAA